MKYFDLFKTADQNMDGKLNYQEFLTIYHLIVPQPSLIAQKKI